MNKMTKLLSLFLLASLLLQATTSDVCPFDKNNFKCKLKTRYPFKSFNASEYYKEAYEVENNKTMLREVLNKIIRSGVQYYSYSPCVGEFLSMTDEDPDNKENVFLLYTGESFPKTKRNNDSDTWENEHVWAKSHGFPKKKLGAHTDLHNLRACYGEVNRKKSDYDFKEGGPELCLLSYEQSGSGCKMMSHLSTTDRTFEPPNEFKGDVARIMFYMDLMYHNEGLILTLVDNRTSGTGSPNHGYFSDLYKWSQEFNEPSQIEKQRNERIYCIQGNRNPFIDHPEWIRVIYNEYDELGTENTGLEGSNTGLILAIVIPCVILSLFVLGFAYKSYKGYKGMERVPFYSVFEKLGSCRPNRGQNPIRLSEDEPAMLDDESIN